MNLYKYWSNKTKWHESCLAEIVAATILEADKMFEETTKLNAVKTTWISVQSSPIES